MNKLIKSVVMDGDISVSVLETTDMVNAAIKIHALSPVAAAALGRTLTVCTFMSSNLKNESDRLSVVIKGDGAGGKITVCGNKDLNMRGTVDNPAAVLPLKPNGKLDVGGFVGKRGRITVIKSMGLKEPYSGTSELISGEIAEDFAAYYAVSEQQPTAMALGVKIGTDGLCVGAGGVILQALPFAREESLLKAEEIANSLFNVSSLIQQSGADGLFYDLFGERKKETFYPEYKCLCNRETIERVIASLGKKEAEDIINQQEKIKVNCEFCNAEYVFTEEDVEKIFG